MSYSRRDILDFKTVITAALYNNLQDGIEELFNQIGLVTETGIPKLMVFPLFEVATEESQTTFPIKLSTFDVKTDTVFVQSGRTMLAPEQDFNIVGNNIVLTEGVPVGRTILIYIFKNVPIGEEGSVSGRVIADKTLPLKKLAEMPTASDVGAVAQANGTTIDILNDALNVGLGVHHYMLDTANYTGNLPNSSYRYGIGTIHKRHSGIILVYLHGNSSLPEVCNYYNGETWSGWSTQFLPLSGGTLSGGLTLQGADYINVRLKDIVANTTSIIEHYGKVFQITLQGLNSEDSLQTVKFLMNCNPDSAIDEKLRLIVNDNWYKIYGEHNKPFGYYTGNGSATERKISIGGIGSILTIYSNYGLMFATPYGTWRLSSTDSANTVAVSYLPPNLFKFENGVLTIATNEHHVNNSGVTYSWSL